MARGEGCGWVVSQTVAGNDVALRLQCYRFGNAGGRGNRPQGVVMDWVVVVVVVLSQSEAAPSTHTQRDNGQSLR